MSIDPNVPPAYAPGPRQGGGAKIWIFLGLGCGGMLLLCCGVGVGFVVYAGRSMQGTEDPAAVVAVANGIAEVDLPEGFQPVFSIDFAVPGTGVSIVKVAVFNAANNAGIVCLSESPMDISVADPDQMKVQVDQALQTQPHRLRRLQVSSSRSIEVVVRGQPASFAIQKAQDASSNEEFVQLTGVFPGKKGTGLIIAQLRADQFTEADAEKLARSIK